MSIGKVYLVGAGPGAWDLITTRGLRTLRRAALVVVDDLIPATFLEENGLPMEGQEIVHLKKGEAYRRHGEILESMARAAEAGRTVARLKSGDPFVFGRAHSEMDFLSSRGIPCEAVPGVSAFIAGATLAGLLLTKRETGRSFAVMTARHAGGATSLTFPRADTLVVYMGVEVLREIAASLVESGWSPDAPAVILERISLPDARTCAARLADIADRAEKSRIVSPALLIVGAAAASARKTVRKPRRSAVKNMASQE